MDYIKTIEKVPTWALPYLINSDLDGISDEERQEVDKWWLDNRAEIISPIEDENGEWHEYFTTVPLWGKPCDVVDCEILLRPA